VDPCKITVVETKTAPLKVDEEAKVFPPVQVWVEARAAPVSVDQDAGALAPPEVSTCPLAPVLPLALIVVEMKTVLLKVCCALQVLVLVNSVAAGEAIQVGALPAPLDCRIWPEDPAPLLTDNAPPPTTKFEDIVTA
jgi:hypothetical protein